MHHILLIVYSLLVRFYPAHVKIAQKLDLSWVKSAQQRVEDQYDIMFPNYGDSNFVQDIAAGEFINSSNQRLRRGMEREVGSVWYDRLPNEVSQKGTLNKYAVTTMKRELMIGIHRVNGYLVTRVHPKLMSEIHQADGNCINRIPGVAEEDQLKQAVSTSTNYVEYMKKAKSLWNQQKVCV